MRGLSRSVSCLLVFGLAACASAATSAGTAPTGTSPSGVRTNPDFISTPEIDAGGFRDAYDVVQRLRPTWFTKSRASSASTTMGGTQVSGASSPNGVGLVVYLDKTRMGGPEALRDLSTSSIRSLQFMDAATATARLPGLRSSIVSGA